MKHPIDRRTLGLGIIPTYSDDDNSLLLEGARSVSDVRSDASIVNSTVEATLASLAIPITVASGDVLRFAVMGDFLNNSGSTCTYTYKVKIGTTTVLTGFSSQGTSANRKGLRAEVTILVLSPTSQIVNGIISTGGGTAANVWTVGGGVGTGHAACAENLAVAKNIEFLATANVQNSLTDTVVHAASLQLLRR